MPALCAAAEAGRRRALAGACPGTGSSHTRSLSGSTSITFSGLKSVWMIFSSLHVFGKGKGRDQHCAGLLQYGSPKYCLIPCITPLHVSVGEAPPVLLTRSL